ncbi:MAG: large subunit ribosomal protein L10 [Salibacteraceae bacterium]|jgi:large subunit ribosomal protein L10
MNKIEKNQVIDNLVTLLQDNSHVYVTNTAELDAELTSDLRRACFKSNIDLLVVKNTLLVKAIEKVANKDFGDIPSVLKGYSSLMFSEVANAPAKLIKEFRAKQKVDRPVLKAAYVEESVYIGNETLEALVSLKSKDELIGDVISLLQSPAKTVISQLQSGGATLAGLMKTLSEKES